MDQQTLILVGAAMLAVLALGGAALAFVGPSSGSSGRLQKRLESAKTAKVRIPRGKEAVTDNTAQRRKQVQDTLKELERKQKEQQSRLTLRARIEQAGLDIDERTFWIASAITGLVSIGLLMIWKQPIYVAIMIGFAAAFGLPRWVLGFLKSRRQAAFINEFANSIDIVVRGVKSGLPLNDCLRVIASESPEPVGPEFQELVEGLKVGVTIDQGLRRMYDRMPLPEVNFFAIVLAIQSKTGGNLSEALGNLSGVLRDRKRMKAKIQAMSSEAKASAGIIGSLPFMVMLLVYLSSPDYITLLFTERLGNILLAIGGFWMSMGIFVMRTMINFKI